MRLSKLLALSLTTLLAACGTNLSSKGQLIECDTTSGQCQRTDNPEPSGPNMCTDVDEDGDGDDHDEADDSSDDRIAHEESSGDTDDDNDGVSDADDDDDDNDGIPDDNDCDEVQGGDDDDSDDAARLSPQQSIVSTESLRN